MSPSASPPDPAPAWRPSLPPALRVPHQGYSQCQILLFFFLLVENTEEK